MGEFFKWFFVSLIALVIMSAVGFAMSSAGLLGRTVVERKVYENSYQRSESLKSQIAADQAALSEIQMKLNNHGLDEQTRINLEAQASAARIRIQTAKGKQQ